MNEWVFFRQNLLRVQFNSNNKTKNIKKSKKTKEKIPRKVIKKRWENKLFISCAKKTRKTNVDLFLAKQKLCVICVIFLFCFFFFIGRRSPLFNNIFVCFFFYFLHVLFCACFLLNKKKRPTKYYDKNSVVLVEGFRVCWLCQLNVRNWHNYHMQLL